MSDKEIVGFYILLWFSLIAFGLLPIAGHSDAVSRRVYERQAREELEARMAKPTPRVENYVIDEPGVDDTADHWITTGSLVFETIENAAPEWTLSTPLESEVLTWEPGDYECERWVKR